MVSFSFHNPWLCHTHGTAASFKKHLSSGKTSLSFSETNFTINYHHLMVGSIQPSYKPFILDSFTYLFQDTLDYVQMPLIFLQEFFLTPFCFSNTSLSTRVYLSTLYTMLSSVGFGPPLNENGPLKRVVKKSPAKADDTLSWKHKTNFNQKNYHTMNKIAR